MSIIENLPYGFELLLKEDAALNHYLRLKMIGRDSEVDAIIPEVDVYSCDPWDLPSKSKIKSDKIWWFFTRPDYKNPSSSSSSSKNRKRSTKSGSWKITGAEREIKDPVTKAGIGKKKILVFLPSGRTPGQKNDWVVHEYSLAIPHQRDYVICRLEYKNAGKASTSGCDDGEPSGEIISVCDIETPVENKRDEKAGTPSCNEGEPSSDVIHVSDIKNPVQNKSDEKAGTPGCNEGEPSGDIIHVSDIEIPVQNKSNEKAGTPGCNEGEPRGDIIYVSNFENPVQNKSDEKAGTPGREEGEPSSGIASVSNIENSVAPAAIFEVYGHLEGNADSLSQPIVSPDCYLTREDISLIFDGGQIVNYEHHPEPENELPGPPGCDEGEPRSDIPSNVRNPLAHAAISEDGHLEGSAASFSQPIVSPDSNLTKENINGFNGGHNINYEHHAKPKIALPGSPGCDNGETRGNILSNIGNLVSHAAISEEQGHVEGNTDSLSELPLPPDCHLTAEDISSIFNNDQNFQFMREYHHPETENFLPYQKTYVLCHVKKKADDKAHTPLDCDVAEPSGDITSGVENPVSPTATSQAHGNEEVNQESSTQPLYSPVHNLTDDDISLSSPIGFVRNHNEMQDCYGAGATEESPEEIMNRLLADPDADQDPKYNGETTCIGFNICSPQTSRKRAYLGNGLVGSDTDTEGVNGRAKKPRSLALGQSFQ